MHRERQTPWAIAGVVEAEINQVWKALLEGTEELSAVEKAAILNRTAGSPFRKNVAAQTTSLEIDASRRLIAWQGQWWYCGVTSLEEHSAGTLLTHHVYNIAPGGSWWIAQLFHRPQHGLKMHQQLRRTLEVLGQTLHCRVYPLD